MIKKATKFAILFLTAAFVTGCGGSSSSSVTADMAYSGDGSYYDNSADVYESADESGYETKSDNFQSGRKLIRTISMDLQTKDFDDVTDKVMQKIDEFGGYIQDSNIYGEYGDGTREAYYSIRIPADDMDAFSEQISGISGGVIRKSESTEDVTLKYVDVDSRISSLKTELERLESMLGEAEDLETLLMIEDRLSEVRYELERYASTQRTLDSQIEYGTVDVNIEEVERITNTDKSFFGEVAERFGSSMFSVIKGVRGLAIWFLGSIPLIAVWALSAYLITLPFRRKGKKKSSKDEKNDIS